MGIALPMTIAGASTPLLGLVDTAILGHLEHPQFLAAVAIGSSIMIFIGWLFAFLRMGNSGLAAQALGSNNHSRNIEILWQSVALGFALGLFLMLIHVPVLTLAVDLMKPSGNTNSLSFEYCQIRIFAAPAAFASSALQGWLLGNQRARACVALLLFINLLNIVLDFWLVWVLQMNSAGAAWASFTSEWFGFLAGLGLVSRHGRGLPSASGGIRLLNPAAYAPLFTVNWHLFLRTCCIVFTLAFFHAQGARQGDTILAANAILIQLLLLVAYSQDGFANAAESLAGHAIGARQRETFYQVSRLVIAWGFTLAVIATLLLLTLENAIIPLFSTIPEVIRTLHRYWPWLTLLPLASAFCFMADGLFIGAGKSRDMLNTTLLATFGIFLPCWWLARPLGNDGLWLAYVLFLLMRSVLMGGVFLRTCRRNDWY